MLRFLLAAFFLPLISSQIPVPPRPDGFTLGSLSAAIVIDAHLDLLCPYCAQAHPTLSALTQHYTQVRCLGHIARAACSSLPPSHTTLQEQLRVVYHSFPLPYHRNAFLSSQASPLSYIHIYIYTYRNSRIIKPVHRKSAHNSRDV